MAEPNPDEARYDRDRVIAVSMEGAALLRVGDVAGADAAFAALDRIAEDPTLPHEVRNGVRMAVAQSYLNWLLACWRKQNYGEAVAASDVVLKRYATHPPPDAGERLARATRLRARAFARGGNVDVAASILQALVAGHGHHDSASVQGVIGLALYDLGALRRRGGDTKGAISAYRDVEERYADSESGDARRSVVLALHDRFVLLRERRDDRAALDTIDRLLARPARDRVERVEQLFVNAEFARTVLLRQLGRATDADQARDLFIAEHEVSPLPVARKWVAQALSEKAASLFGHGDYDDAIAVDDRLIDLARGDVGLHGPLRRFFALGMSERALALEELGRWSEVEPMFDEMLVLLDGPRESATDEQVARALARNGLAMRAGRHFDRALARWRQVLASFSVRDAGDVVRLIIARARLEQLELLTLTHQESEAMTAADEARALIDEHAIADDVRARIMSSSTAAYYQCERFQDAVLLADRLVQEFGASNDDAIRQAVALALQTKLAALAAMGLAKETADAYADAVDRFGEQIVAGLRVVADELRPAADARSRVKLAIVLYRQAMFLSSLDKNREALDVLDSLIDSYGSESSEELRKLVASARATRQEIEAPQRRD